MTLRCDAAWCPAQRRPRWMARGPAASAWTLRCVKLEATQTAKSREDRAYLPGRSQQCRDHKGHQNGQSRRNEKVGTQGARHRLCPLKIYVINLCTTHAKGRCPLCHWPNDMVSYKKLLKFFDSSRTAAVSPAPRRVHGCHLWRRFRAQAAVSGRPSAVGREGPRRRRHEGLGGCRDSNGTVEAVDSNRHGPSGLHLLNQDRGSVGSGNASSQP